VTVTTATTNIQGTTQIGQHLHHQIRTTNNNGPEARPRRARTSRTTTTVTGNRRNLKRSETPLRGKIPFVFESNFFHYLCSFFGKIKVGEEIITRKRIIEREGGIELKIK
jgi:hypothetical protein